MIRQRAICTLLLWIYVLGERSWGADEFPIKLAEMARFDLVAVGAVSELADGQVSAGGAKIERMTWLPAVERPRGYMVSIPVTHFAWREATVKFTPRASGLVTLRLHGPWEQAPAASIYRQEVWWDAIRLEGASLKNGSFETDAEWSLNPRAIVAASADVPAVEGRRVAKTWHNDSLTTSVRVTAGQPVTIRVHTRAVWPEGFVDMRRVAGKNSPAHLAAKRFRRGVNFGNFLEVPPTQPWALEHTPDDIARIAAEGFDHIRFPIGWHHFTGPAPEFTLSEDIFRKVDLLVEEATRHKLAVIVNVHHFHDFTTNPAAHMPKFRAIWKQLAQHYAKSPETVAFELLNEPKDAATTSVLNSIYADAIKLIRETNPQRPIFVGPGKFNGVEELLNLRLPDDDLNLIVTVHSYKPYQFTHQGTSWSGPDMATTGIRFPGPPKEPLSLSNKVPAGSWMVDWLKKYNTLPGEANPCSELVPRDIVKLTRAWSDYYGRPIHFGEFGTYITGDDQSRANYVRTVREACDAADLGWCLWDWKAGFRYWDVEKQQPVPGFREALFPKK